MCFNLKKMFTTGTLLFACLSLILTGCGGSGGGGATTASVQTISGIVSKGPVEGATVTVWQLVNGQKSAKLGETVSRSDGRYSLVIPASSGPVLVEVTGNSAAAYLDENNPTGPRVQFNAGHKFRTAVPDVTTAPTIVVTPLTEAAVQVAAQADGTLPTADIKKANGALSNLLGLDIVTTLPNNVAVNQISDLNNDRDRYGAYLAGIQRQTAVEGKTVEAVITSLVAPIINNVALGEAGTNFLSSLNAVISNSDINPTGVTRLPDATTLQSAITAPVPIPESDTTPPSAPTGLTAALDNVKTVKLSWNASASADTAGYMIFRNGDLIATVKTLLYYDSSDMAYTTYTYTVKAFDGARNASAVSSVTITLHSPVVLDTTPPSQPQGLAVSSVGSGSVTLTWNASTDAFGVQGYTIFRNGQKTASVTNPGYTDTQVAANTQYRYQVMAFDAAGNASAAGSEVTVLTLAPAQAADTQPPTAPLGLTASDLTSGSVKLVWNPATDNSGVVAGYRIYRDTKLLDTVKVPGFSDCTVGANTTYKYTVTAFDAAGNASAASNEVTLVTLANPQATDVTPPTAPTGLFSPNFTRNTVNLAWNVSMDNERVAGYHIYRDGAKIATVTQPGYSDTPLAANTLYTYRVGAFDPAGNVSAFSADLSVTTLPESTVGDTQKPSAPTNLAASAVTDRAITLTWTAATDNVGVVKYDIYRNGLKISSVTAAGLTDALGLTPSTTYRYTIQAFDGANNASSFSAELAVTTAAPSDVTAPTAPAKLTAVSISSTAITLAWTGSIDAYGVVRYDIYRDGVKIGSTAGSARSFTDTAPDQDGSCIYKVQAVDAAGNLSPFSSDLSVGQQLPPPIDINVDGQVDPGTGGSSIPDQQAPTAPTNLAATTFATSATTSSVVLTWNAATDNIAVVGYEVYRNAVKIATLAKPGCTVTGVPSGTAANYYIVAYDGAGNRSAASSQLTVTPNQVSLNVTVGGQLDVGITGSPSLDQQAPSAPTNLAATAFATSATTSSVVLTWNAATDNVGVAGYEVYRAGVKIATVTQPGYTVTGVPSDTTANYFVIAYDTAANRSVASNQLTITPNQASLGVTVSGQLDAGITGSPSLDTTAPTAPAGLAATTFATSATTSSVVLTWNAATDNVGVAGYEVYRAGVKIATVTQPGYTATGVASGTTANYFVIAYDAAANRSVASNQLTVTPNQASLGVTVGGQLSPGIVDAPSVDVQAPTAPAGLAAATFATSATTSSVVLTWNAATDNVGVAGYEVYRAGVKIATVTQPGYTVTGVPSGTTANYFVIAYDTAANRSVASNQLTVTPNQASLGVTVGGQLDPGIVAAPSL